MLVFDLSIMIISTVFNQSFKYLNIAWNFIHFSQTRVKKFVYFSKMTDQSFLSLDGRALEKMFLHTALY